MGILSDEELIGMLKNYVKKTIEGSGALQGAPCQIQSIVSENSQHVVTFLWEDNEGVTHTDTMTVYDGDFHVFDGATSEAAGSKGAVPAPATTDEEKLLCGDGTWSDKIISETQWTQIQSILA